MLGTAQLRDLLTLLTSQVTAEQGPFAEPFRTRALAWTREMTKAGLL